MSEIYSLIQEKLNIDKETFDSIISDESAKQKICEALYYCLNNVPDLSELASQMLQYLAKTRFDSAWDEWLEENLDEFKSDDEEIAFKKFIEYQPDNDDPACIDLFYKAWRSRGDGEDTQWITVKGTHIPLDDDGKITGKVADKIKETSEKARNHLTEAGAPTMEDDFAKEGYHKNSEGRWQKNAFSTKQSGYVTKYEDEYGSVDLADIDPWEQKDYWEEMNRDKLTDLYKKERQEAKDRGEKPPLARDIVDREWYGSRTEDVTKDLHHIDDHEADEILYKAMDQSSINGWFRNADSIYKPRIVNSIISSPETRNAALSIMYDNYKQLTNGGLSFEDFLTTPVAMYRGGHGQKHLREDVFSAYSFSRDIAEKFAGADGRVYEAKIRPIDTWGSITTNKESEIMVPSWIAPNGNVDHADANDDEEWVTINGTHVLIDDEGVAQGGGKLKGKKFSEAKSSKKNASKSSSSKAEGFNKRISDAYRKKNYSEAERELRKILKELPNGSTVKSDRYTYKKIGENEFEFEPFPGATRKTNINLIANSTDYFDEKKAPKFEVPDDDESEKEGSIPKAETSKSKILRKVDSDGLYSALTAAEMYDVELEKDGHKYAFTNGGDLVDAETGEIMDSSEASEILDGATITSDVPQGFANHATFASEAERKIIKAVKLKEKAMSDMDAGFEYMQLQQEIRTAARDAFPTVSDCMTSSDCGWYLSSKEYFVKPEENEDNDYRDENDIGQFTSMDVELAREACSTLDNLFEKYPVLVGQLQGFRSDDDVTEYDISKGESDRSTYAVSHQIYGVVWDTSTPGHCSKKEIDDSLKRDVNLAFHPKGCDKARSIIEHEYGHQIQGFLENCLGMMPGEFSEEMLTSISGEMKKPIPVVQRLVSEYALKNSEEFLAEAWSEYRVSDSPREIATAVGKWIESKLEEV